MLTKYHVRHRALRRIPLAVLTVSIVVAARLPAVAHDDGLCLDTPLSYEMTSSHLPPPCTISPGGFVLDSSYDQNASKVGGTAVAVYPLAQLTAGVAPEAEIVVDLPSQVAESGLHGAGLYPRSHSGYGFRYQFADNARLAVTSGFEVMQQASPYASIETQARYSLDIASAYRLTPAFTIRDAAQASTSRTVGVGRIVPTEALGAEIASSRRTIFSTELGLRDVAPRAHAQQFGDVGVKELLDRKLALHFGLGTTFNPVANAKAHYLATGLTYRP